MYNDLSRFLKAQEHDYAVALQEIKAGRKRSHWMWYIFPQLAGLGLSDTSKYYAIKDLDEAKEYLHHLALGPRLKEISTALLALDHNNATNIFGNPDDMKLRSSMTLFARADATESIFQKVLDKFFDGQPDQRTIELLKNKSR